MMRFGIAAAFALTMATAPADAKDRAFPPLTGRVVDTANQIPDGQEEQLSRELAAFEMKTGHQMVVVTVPDLGGMDKADYATRIGRVWGIGRKGADDGIVLLQSPGDGKPGSGRVYTAVGTGLEGSLTDAQASVVYNQTMLPILKGEPGTAGEGLDKPERVAPALIAGAGELMRQAAITPAQRAQDERRLAAESERRSAAMRDGLATLLYWTTGILAAMATAFGVWWKATARRRATRRELEERAAERRRTERHAAEERARQAAAEAAAAERARQAERARARSAMLAAMTPQAREKFLDDERRLAEETAAREAAARRLRREQEEREEDERRKRRRAEDDRRSMDIAMGAGLGSTPGNYGGGSSDGASSFSGGGGSFSGGGAGGDY